MPEEQLIGPGEFLPTVTLTSELDFCLRCGTLKLKPGQHVITFDGKKARFLYRRSDGVLAFHYHKEPVPTAAARLKRALDTYRDKHQEAIEREAKITVTNMSLADRARVLFKVA